MSDSEEDNNDAPKPEEVADASVPDQEDAEKLGQGDIDRLMEEASDIATGTVFKANGSRFDSSSPISISPYDFRNPSFLTESELRLIKKKHDKFAHYLASRLSLFLRIDFQLKVKDLQLLTFSQFTSSIPSPTHLGLFTTSELPGIGILNITNGIAFTMINRMLGGRGILVKEERPLTEIEVGLMDEVLELILDEWATVWKDTHAISPSIVGKDNDAKYLNVHPGDSVVMLLELEAQLGESTGSFHLALPSIMLQPIAKVLQENSKQYSDNTKVQKKPRWQDSYSTISVPIHAEWDIAPLSVNDFLKLRTGDILELPKDLLNSTQLRVMNTPCFLGEAGIDDGRVAIKINNKLK